MQITAIAIVFFLLVSSGCMNETLEKLSLRRNTVLFYIMALCACELFHWQVQMGKVTVQPLTLTLVLCAAGFFLFRVPQGWRRFKCVCGGCICCLAVYFCALYFADYADQVLRERTVFAAFVISSVAYILCSDLIDALCAAVFGSVLGIGALHTAHFVLFSDVLQVAFAPMTQYILYCMLFVAVMFVLCDLLQRFVDRRKYVHS